MSSQPSKSSGVDYFSLATGVAAVVMAVTVFIERSQDTLNRRGSFIWEPESQTIVAGFVICALLLLGIAANIGFASSRRRGEESAHLAALEEARLALADDDQESSNPPGP